MSRRQAAKYRRQTSVTIPERVGPHVKLVFSEMHRLNWTYDDVEEGSGVRRITVKAWRRKNRPSLESIESVLGFMGYDFVPIPRAGILPPEVLKKLRPIAEELSLSMPQAVQAITEIVTGIHGRLRTSPTA